MYMYIYRRFIVSDYRMLVKEYRICMPLTVEEVK